jgi:hypothetical protein
MRKNTNKEGRMKKCKTLREARKEFKKLTGYDYGDRGTPHEPAIRNYKGRIYKYIICTYLEWLDF